MGQMIQFVIMNAQAIYLLKTECSLFPRNILIAYGIYIFSLLILFANFYVASYLFSGDKKSSKGDKSSAVGDKVKKG